MQKYHTNPINSAKKKKEDTKSLENELPADRTQAQDTA